MQTTEKLILQKPSYEDAADINIINTNMDILDEAFGKLDSGKVGKDELPNFEHFIKMIVSEEGVHGLRYFGNVLQAYIDGSWVVISAADMTKAVYDPNGKNTDIFAYAEQAALVFDSVNKTYYRWGVENGRLYLEEVVKEGGGA